MYRYIEELKIRKTHKYVATYSDLDDWEDLGASFLYNSCRVFEDQILLVGIIDMSMPQEKAELALRSIFSKAGCACDHDCCGCSSHIVGDVDFKDRYVTVEILTTINN